VLSQPLQHLRFNLFITSETFAIKVVFLADQTGGNHYEPSLGCNVDVQTVPNLLVVLEFSPGFLGLYWVWNYHDEAVLFLLVGLDIFYELHPKASTQLYSMIQNSHFHHISENGLTVLPENPKPQ
jgi:hypothetical protein